MILDWEFQSSQVKDFGAGDQQQPQQGQVEQGEYFIAFPDGRLHRVRYVSRKDVEAMRYLAKIAAENIEPLRGPIYAYSPLKALQAVPAVLVPAGESDGEISPEPESQGPNNPAPGGFHGQRPGRPNNFAPPAAVSRPSPTRPSATAGSPKNFGQGSANPGVTKFGSPVGGANGQYGGPNPGAPNNFDNSPPSRVIPLGGNRGSPVAADQPAPEASDPRYILSYQKSKP